MRTIAPLKPTLRKAQCRPFEAQGKRVRHPNLQTRRGRMLRFTSNEAQASAGSYEKTRTLETEGCGTQTSKPDVAECYALIEIDAGRPR
jgi:hypothetical protein